MSKWLDSLGPDYISKSAPLSMACCWIHVLRGEDKQIPKHLANVKSALRDNLVAANIQQPMKLTVIPSLVEMMEATILLDRKQARQAETRAQKAIALIPDAADQAIRNLLQGAAAYRLALAYKELGEYDHACAVLLEGLEMLKSSQNYFGVAATILQIMSIYRTLGNTAQAIALCQETLDFITAQHWQNVAPASLIHVILADLLADEDDYEATKTNLEMGRGQANQLSAPYVRQLVTGVERRLEDWTPLPQPLVEPLSPREFEVLQLLAQGLSNREIGERLFLALAGADGSR